ncbi:MAG: hypothetical protein KJ060_09230 [Candidatus Hydrogenedentes bacterium]|nr:hypothetical protein [Candidatus Hydrogenedentota bacterium]
MQILTYVIGGAAVVFFVWMLRLASKEKLILALLVGALCTMCIGFYPALQLSGFGETIAETVQGEEGVEVVAASPVKKPLSVVLWLILFAVPGPFLAVAAQVIFRSIKRVRSADVDTGNTP